MRSNACQGVAAGICLGLAGLGSAAASDPPPYSGTGGHHASQAIAPSAGGTVVQLADGAKIDVAAQAPLILDALGRGQLPAVLHDLLGRGLNRHAAAVVAYASQAAPDAALRLASMAVRVADETGDTYFAGLAVSALSHKLASPQEAITALASGVSSAPVRAAVLAAVAEPAAAAETAEASVTDAPAESGPPAPQQAPQSSTSRARFFGSSSPFDNSLLPDLLRIGGSGGGGGDFGANDPPPDGGAS